MFKSPAPSNKKLAFTNGPKSPIWAEKPNITGSNAKNGTSSFETWMISPVCSRLHEHIHMLNGASQKERIFLQSPMQYRMLWSTCSPAVDHSRTLYSGSTAQNTSAGSKDYSGTLMNSEEPVSNMKRGGMIGDESPVVMRRFMDSENGITCCGSSVNKIHEKASESSEFKSYQPVQNSNLKKMHDYLPCNFDHVTFHLDSAEPIPNERLIEQYSVALNKKGSFVTPT